MTSSHANEYTTKTMESPESPAPPQACLAPSERALSPVETKRVDDPQLHAQQRAPREQQRERERTSRHRRVEKSQQMRVRVAELEQVALALRLVPDADSIWDEYVDDNIKKLRTALRRLLSAVQETRHLQHANTQFQQRLYEYRFAAMVINQVLVRDAEHYSDWQSNARMWEAMTRERHVCEASLKWHHPDKVHRGMDMSDWLWKCERWRAITCEYYEPLSKPQCDQVVDETLATIRSYKVPKQPARGDTPSVFGWFDTRGLDGSQRSVHFNALKTHHRSDLDDAVEMCWRMYQDGDTFQQFMLGESVQLYYKVLQRVSDDIVVIQNVEKYPGLEMTVHSISIAFRLKTQYGYLIAMRCIKSPKLQNAMKQHGLSEADTFYWCTWAVTARDEQTSECIEYQTSVNGSISATDPAYAQRWVLEGVLALLRIESKLYGTQPLMFQAVAAK